MPTIKKVARTVNSQENPNVTKRLSWKNCTNAIVGNTKAWASSTFENKYTLSTKGKDKGKYTVSKNYPWTLTAHKFGLDIPKEAYINSVTFRVRMRANNTHITIPNAVVCLYGSSYSTKYDNTKNKTTGFEKGLYQIIPSTKMSKSWHTYQYKMSSDVIRQTKSSIKDWNKEVMGIDLRFDTCEFTDSVKPKKGAKSYSASATIDVAWVQIEVDYELPKYNIKYSRNTTKKNPYSVVTGDEHSVTATFTQSTNASGGKQALDVELPWGTDLSTVYEPVATNSTFDAKTMKWTVPTKGKTTSKLKLTLVTRVHDVSQLNIGNNTVKHYPYYYIASNGYNVGYGNLSIDVEGEVHKDHLCCATVNIEAEDNDGLATIWFSKKQGAVQEPYDDLEVVSWDLISASDGVSIDYSSGDTVFLDCPADEQFNAVLRCCFYCHDTGLKNYNLYYKESLHKDTMSFKVEEPYVYHITTSPTDKDNQVGLHFNGITIKNHRIIGDLSTSATILSTSVDEFDSLMIIDGCNVKMQQFDEVDYIGCVPLEHLHFNPKSTYKDKLLDTHYKNKRYMGKQLASDEDITLNVRLHPQQVTTIQGLIDMDKPIPINANHKCFEGDALNHRGYAEIYGITTTETNPHWYKCEINVKYLTHNLNTRFHILKGNKVNQVEVNDMLSEVFGSGEALSSGDENNDYFIVDTDGTYMYNEDDTIDVDYLNEEGREIYYNGTNVYYLDDENNEVILTYDDNGTTTNYTGETYTEYLESNNYVVNKLVANEPVTVRATIGVPDSQKNMFSIDEGQHITVTTQKTLPSTSEIVFEWSSVLLEEIRENNVERIIELVRKSDNEPVFKYQYSDMQFIMDNSGSTPVIDSVNANPIAYVLKNGDWITYTENIALRTDFETGGIIDDSDTATPVDSEEDSDYLDINDDTSDLIYGSTVHFRVADKTLKVIDEGFNGREWEVPTVKLDDGDYYWRTIWTNKNSDGESNDIVCFFNFQVNDTVLDSQYATNYSNMIVSPFPVAKKQLLFTRNAEEGTVYYYNDDLEEFSYLVEPYYQYQNGTDLVTDSGISIFNLNYGYKLVYIQNGLVRLGFDRINGIMYLGKYDPNSQQYITTHHLRFEKYTDINIKSISDDKIEIQASDCIFTIYRGHPFIVVNHNTENLMIDTPFDTVWAEKVGNGGVTELPTYWDLMNNANLLPLCVGGDNEIKSSCIEVESVDDSDKRLVPLYWSTTFDNIEVGTSRTFQFGSDQINYSDELDLYGHQCDFGEYEVTFETDNTAPYQLFVSSNTDKIIANEHMDINGQVVDYDLDGMSNQDVVFSYDDCSTDGELILSADKVFVSDGENATITVKAEVPINTLYDNAEEVDYTSTGTKVFDGVATGLDIGNKDWVLEFDINNPVTGTGGLSVGATSQYTPPSTANYRLFMGTDSQKFTFNNRTSTSNTSTGGSRALNTWYHFKLVKQGTSVSAYVDGELFSTKTVTWLSNYDSFDIYAIAWSGTTLIKNITLKEMDNKDIQIRVFEEVEYGEKIHR